MLTKPLAVMINRGGASLDAGRAAAGAVGLPPMGEDPEDLVLSDAGNAMIGFGFKQSQANLNANQCCSRNFLNDVNVEVANPASHIELVPPNFQQRAERAADALNIARADLADAVTRSRRGSQFSFHDGDGNLTVFLNPQRPARPGPADRKLLDILDRRGVALGGAGPVGSPPVATGFGITVSNIRRTANFYGTVLGLASLSSGDRGIRFDAGPIILTAQVEPNVGLVRSLRERALLRDQLIFYTPDIRPEVDNLIARGVEFPLGIEESISAGAVAFFQDPDGHNLWLWQPPQQFTPDMRINYFPTLERILAENA